MKRRIISVLTALALVLGLCPAWAFATEGDGTPKGVRVGTAEALLEAVKEYASEGATGEAVITLTNDIDLAPAWLQIKGGTITLDCGGHTLTGSGPQAIAVGEANLTVKNGTVKNSNGGGHGIINANGSVTVESSAVISAEGADSNGITTSGSGQTDAAGKVTGTLNGIRIIAGSVTLQPGAMVTGRASAILFESFGSETKTVNVAEGRAYFGNQDLGTSITGSTMGGTLVVCSNHQVSISDEGVISCPNCNLSALAAAKVEKEGDGYPVFVSSLQEAFAAEHSDATVTLLDNVSLNETTIEPAGTFTLDLNGKTITGNSTGNLFELNNNATLTVNGEGSIVSDGRTIHASSGKLILNGGTIQTNSASSNAVRIASNAKAEITGGRIIGCGTGRDSALRVYTSVAAAVTVTGGTITGGIYVDEKGTTKLCGGAFEGAEANGTSVEAYENVRDLLGSEGEDYYAYYRDNSPIPVSKLGKKLTGTVTVEECEHPKSEAGYTITATTHQAVCTTCGKQGEAVSHEMTSDKTHCGVCGYFPEPVLMRVNDGEEKAVTMEKAVEAAKNKDNTKLELTLLGDIPETGGSPSGLYVPADKTVTIEGNNHSLGGYALAAGSGTLTANNCIVNWGISIVNGSATFTGCQFDGIDRDENRSMKVQNGSVEFNNCKFTDQKIYNNYKKSLKEVFFNGCTFDNTEASVSSNNTTFTNCTFTNSLASVGNAAFNDCRMNGYISWMKRPEDRLVVEVYGTADFADCTINTPSGSCIGVHEDSSENEIGAAIIHSGTYTSKDAPALYIASTGATELTGGTFSSILIAEQTGGGEPITTTLPELLGNTDTVRYAYHKDGSPVVLSTLTDAKELTGTVEVKACQDHGTIHVPDTLTHSDSCPYCGYQAGAEAVPCTYEFEGNTGTCAACGDALTVAVTAPESLVYDGQAKDFTASVKRGETELAAVKDYLLICSANPCNAGEVSLSVVIGKEQGTYTKKYTITPKPLTVTGVTVVNRAYNGTNQVVLDSVTLGGVVSEDEDQVSAVIPGPATISGTDAGTYNAVTLPALGLKGAQAGNYTLTPPAGPVAAAVTIAKADPLTAKTGDLAVANERAHTYTLGLGSLLPEVPDGMRLGGTAVTYELKNVNISGGYYGGSGAAISGQTLTLPIRAVDSKDEGKIGTVTVTIKTGNFKDMTATINVRSVNKIVPQGEPALSKAVLTYGEALSAITLSGVLKDGDKEVPGTFAWSSPDHRPAAQARYEAAWVFTPADNGTYAIVNGTSPIRVEPASLAKAKITLSQTAFRQDGDTVQKPVITEVKLGDTLLRQDVDYTALIPEKSAPGTYKVQITGTNNYTGTAEAAFTINEVKQENLDQKDDKGRDLRLEVETGLSSVPDAFASDPQYEKYNTPAKIENELRTKVQGVLSNTEEQIAVLDVTLQYKDGNGQWQDVDPQNFPEGGVTVILPYPEGTGMTGYRFTVQHLISSGEQLGKIETMQYEKTSGGLKCKFLTLSPVAIGYQAEEKPVDPKPSGGSGSSGSSSSSGAGRYSVSKAPGVKNGSVSLSTTSAKKGDTVTVTPKPDKGYEVEGVTVLDKNGNEIRVREENGRYTFTMPDGKVTVEAAFRKIQADAEPEEKGFVDVPAGAYYAGPVAWAVERGITNGTSATTFSPSAPCTRAQIVTFLWRAAGSPAAGGTNPFTDVAPGAYYYDAVLWAVEQGITGGTTATAFSPDRACTRAQTVTFLYRYEKSPAAGEANPFTDVAADAYYTDAVLWAVEKGITGGTTASTFSPDAPCTRGQIVTFLYRDMA